MHLLLFVVDVMAAPATRWKDNPSIYPPAHEIAKGINDHGNAGSKGHRYPALEKLCLALFQSVSKTFGKPEGLDTNSTRGKRKIAEILLLKRKSVDIVETDPFFHPFGKDGKVFVLTNNPNNCGLDVVVDALQDCCQAQAQMKNVARTSNDGLRLGCLMLDPKYRGSVSKLMSNKKQRKSSDQTGDTTLHLFETFLEDFSDIGYHARTPAAEYHDQFPEDEKSNWDPNHISIFENERTGLWLKDTWEQYTKPKYKKALNKWNKETGGGDGTAPSFINYCAKGDRWLVWLFCIDKDTNFLIGSSCGGRMPRYLQMESGFVGEEVSSLDESSKKELLLEEELDAARKQREELKQTTQEVRRYLHKKEQEEVSPSRDATKVRILSDMIENPPSSLSPDSKETCVEDIKEQRKDALERMKKRRRQEHNDTDNNAEGAD